MARYFFIFLLIIAICLFEISSFSVFFSGRMVPDLILIVSILWTVIYGFDRMWGRILMLGILFDLVAFNWPGMHILSLVTVAFMISFLSSRFLASDQMSKFLMMIVFVLLGTIVQHAAIIAVTSVKNVIAGNSGGMSLVFNLKDIIVQSVLNITLAFIIYHPLVKMEKFITSITKGKRLGKAIKV